MPPILIRSLIVISDHTALQEKVHNFLRSAQVIIYASLFLKENFQLYLPWNKTFKILSTGARV